MTDLHQSLAVKEMIKPVHVGNRKLFEITSEGRNMAKKLGIKIRWKDAKGGIEHAYWINETCQFLRNFEFQPVCEAQDIDITDSKAGLAIEIETGKSNIGKNLLKLDKSRFTRCFMLATNKMAEFKIKSKKSDFPCIFLMHAKDFLKLTRDQILIPSSIHSCSHSKNEVTATTEQ